MSQDYAAAAGPHATGMVDALLDGLGPVQGLRALVIGPGALEAMCALMARGCVAATEMQGGDRIWPEPDSAELVIVPHVASIAQAGDAVSRGRRALIMGGRLAMRDVTGHLRAQLASVLRLQGLHAVRTRLTRAGTVLVAERPIFGPLPRFPADAPASA